MGILLLYSIVYKVNASETGDVQSVGSVGMYRSVPHIRPHSRISPPTFSVEVLAQVFLSRK